MKIFILGIVSILISIVLFALGHIYTLPYIEKLSSWSTPPGKYLTSLYETGNIFPITLSLIFLVVGLFLIIIHMYKKSKKTSSSTTIDK